MRVLALVHAAIVVGFATAGRPRVDAGVHRTLKRQGTANIIVSMRAATKPVLESMAHEAAYESRGAMIENMMTKLKTHAATNQAEITTLLAHESSTVWASEVRSFWITNQVYFRDASFELVEKLSAMTAVADIAEEAIFPMAAFAPVKNTSTITASSISSRGAEGGLWNIERIQAPEVWQTGNTGQGVVVGAIDGGVRATHKALKANFRREFGWFDPENRTTEPSDEDGHGTFTMATIAGANGYGVAPGATWITCKGCKTDQCPQSLLLACAQFMLCPTDPTGEDSDCSKAPRVINNSWVGVTSWFFSQYTSAWRRAGIIPVFSAGNTGPKCYTLQSPADFDDTIGVGATDRDDGLPYFSSRGPRGMGFGDSNINSAAVSVASASTSLVKPDITAPGTDIVSAWYTDDEAEAMHDGTSASAPHIVGVIALLLSAEPRLSFDQVLSRLQDTADQAILRPTSQTCGGSTDGVFPNYMYGSGRVNALSAIKGKRAPAPGKCDTGLDQSQCDGAFLCTWNIATQKCQRWW